MLDQPEAIQAVLSTLVTGKNKNKKQHIHSFISIEFLSFLFFFLSFFSFGITPTMDKLYHRGVMRTKCDDCQFVCITQTDYFSILHKGEENTRRHEENGRVVLVTEQQLKSVQLLQLSDRTLSSRYQSRQHLHSIPLMFNLLFDECNRAPWRD